MSRTRARPAHQRPVLLHHRVEQSSHRGSDTDGNAQRRAEHRDVDHQADDDGDDDPADVELRPTGGLPPGGRRYGQAVLLTGFEQRAGHRGRLRSHGGATRSGRSLTPGSGRRAVRTYRADSTKSTPGYDDVVDVDEPARILLTVRETARRLGVHENTVRNWARDGLLPTARLPGSRFHRFDERDVERLRRQRGATVASVEADQSVLGPELVDATQLVQWADTRAAQQLFPELMRRLLASTAGVTNISVRAGDGVALGGWDGRATAQGTPYLPDGHLAFEFSVGASPAKKANENYLKRSHEGLAAERASTCFVFATPRRWRDGARWASVRARERVFADVRVIDADDLEGWLEQTPVVHYWISEALGHRPRDAETLNKWWDRFRSQTVPPLPSELFTSGRDEQQEQLKSILAGPPAIATLQAEWVDDAQAFVAAVNEMLRANADGPTFLVVRSAEVWDRVVDSPGRMALVPTFANPALDTAIRHGKHVVLLADRERPAVGESIRLGRPDRRQAADALRKAGVENFERADQLAALARRSMPALIRRLAHDRRLSHPAWTQPPDVHILAPLMLACQWTTTDADLGAVIRLTGEMWPNIERTLLGWQAKDGDSPFVKSGDQWRLTSPEEGLILLDRYLTSVDFDRWHETVRQVILQEHQLGAEEAEDGRPFGADANSHRYSSVLRRGLMQGLVLAGSSTDSESWRSRERARVIALNILGHARTDESGHTWRSLADVMPLLAEAAPADFLDAVSDDLDLAEPRLTALFQDQGQESWMYSSSQHTGLLWALECLGWSPDYLVQSCMLLARLHLLDPGGRLGNRPIASLSTVLAGWIRNTSASLDDKIATLKGVCARFPDVGWRLIGELWPRHHMTSIPPYAPRYRDWKPERRQVSFAEWGAYIHILVRQAVELANQDAERWIELASMFSGLPPTEREPVLRGLDELVGRQSLSTNMRLRLWESLDAEVRKHEQFASSGWYMGDADLQRVRELATRVEPTTDVQRYTYLFDWHPRLNGIDAKDHERYQVRLHSLRVEAVADMLRPEAARKVGVVAERCKAPAQLGAVVAEVTDSLTDEMLKWLDADSPALQELAHGWARYKIATNGVQWFRTSLQKSELMTRSGRRAFALAAPARAEMWDAMDSDLLSEYWQAVPTPMIEDDDLMRAATSLVEHKRAWVAVDLLALHLHEPDRTVAPTKLVITVLDAVLTEGSMEPPGSSAGYELGVLLDYLERQGAADQVLIRYEYYFCRLLENYRAPRALHQALSSDAELFVDLAARVYRAKNEPRRPVDEAALTHASLAWEVLHEWSGAPGLHSDGSIDVPLMKRWIKDARLRFADSDRADIGDELIGHRFAWYPAGKDGVWPAEPVRELIEEIGSQSLAAGIHLGTVNKRGVTVRSPYDGGQQEWSLVEKYRSWARTTSGLWPRTSRILRNVAESYERDARREDAEAESLADGD